MENANNKSASQVIVPANDKFANATKLQGFSGSLVGSNANATAEKGEPRHRGAAARKSVWYRWQAPHQDGIAIFTTVDSRFKSRVAVYAEMREGNDFSILSRVDEFVKIRRTDLLIFHTKANQRYRIAIDGVGAASGSFKLDYTSARDIREFSSFGFTIICGFVRDSNLDGIEKVNLSPVDETNTQHQPVDTFPDGSYALVLSSIHTYRVTPTHDDYCFDPVYVDYPVSTIAPFEHYTGFECPLFNFSGVYIDRISPDVLAPDGQSDGTFAVSFQEGIGNAYVTEITLRSDHGKQWSTNPDCDDLVLGVAREIDAPLLNNTQTGGVNFDVTDGSNLFLFASKDGATNAFPVGTEFEVVMKLADGRTLEAHITLDASPAELEQ